jgi:hypothetical protein
MHKFHSIAALCGDGLRPELRELFERLAIDPRSGQRIRYDGMVQAGPDPVSKASTQTEDRNMGASYMSKEGDSRQLPTMPCERRTGSTVRRGQPSNSSGR